MRAMQLAASGALAVAVLVLPARHDAARADDGGPAPVTRPFSLGAVSAERTAGAALRLGRFECWECTGVPPSTIAAWDLSIAWPIADRVAVFALQPVLFRGTPVPGLSSYAFPGALTAGVRHVGAVGESLVLAAAASVSLPVPGAGGVAAPFTNDAQELIDDGSLYKSELGTLRIELDARWRWSALFAQAQLALAAHSTEESLLGSSRAGVGVGADLWGRVALLVELTGRLGAGGITCGGCYDREPWIGAGKPVLSVGGRVALGAWTLGARGFLPQTAPAGEAPTRSVAATVDVRF